MAEAIDRINRLLERAKQVFAERGSRNGTTEDLDAYAEHVYPFSLAGIRSIREHPSSSETAHEH